MSLPIAANQGKVHPNNSGLSIINSRPGRRIIFLTLSMIALLLFFLTPSEHIKSIQSSSQSYLRQHFASSSSEQCSVSSNALINAGPTNRTEKPRAAFVALVRERQLHGLLKTMRDLQTAFNDQPDNSYKYIFLSEKPFTDFFKNRINAFLQDWPSPSIAEFGLVPKEDWDIPNHINMTKAKERWDRMGKTRIPYGGSKSYRQMCRFYSAPIYHHPLLKDLDYVWRIEPDTRHLCKFVSHYKKGSDGVMRWIERDPFRHMKETGKKYGFAIAMKEYVGTVRTLFVHVNKWRWSNPHFIPKENLRKFVSDDDKGYNKCHFWTNFEIVDLSFPRSEAYQSFFNYLDREGGFFYERWGDAPVRSIAASLLLNKDEIWHVDYAGYYHAPYGTCPRVPDPGAQCACDPHTNYDYDASHVSCKANWDDAIGNNSTEIIQKINEENGYPGFQWDHAEAPYAPWPLRLSEV